MVPGARAEARGPWTAADSGISSRPQFGHSRYNDRARLNNKRRFSLDFAVAALQLLLLALIAVLLLEGSNAPPPVVRPTADALVPITEHPLTRRVLLVILDAWRRKVALDDSRMPLMAEFAHRGSRGAVLTGVRTFTKACVRTMMTGREATLSDSARNLAVDSVTEPTLLTRLTESNRRFALIGVTDDLRDLFGEQSPWLTIITPPTKGLAWDARDPAHDAAAETAGTRELDDPNLTLVVVHLESLDLAGHIDFPDTPAYNEVLLAADARIRRLADQLNLRRDTLFVIGDHGTDDVGHHGGPERLARETAYVALGAGIRHGSSLLDEADVADTLAVLFGLCPPDASEGAPQPDLLAISGKELKRRCDRCLRARTTAFANAPEREKRAYLEEPSFTPAVAARYKELLGVRQAPRLPPAAPLVAAASIAVGLWSLRRSQPRRAAWRGWIVPGALLGLSFSAERDSLAVAACVGGLVVLAFRERNGRGAAAMLGALTLFGVATGWASELVPDRAMRDLAAVAVLSAAVALTVPVLRSSKVGRGAILAPTGAVAAVVGSFIASNQMPGTFSWDLALVDYALAVGALFFIMGLLTREDPLIGLGSLALAACFFRGWPLVVFASVATLLASKPKRRPGTPLVSPSSFWAPLGALAFLRVVHGGYGFSKIDLSLSVVGIRWEGVPNYAWAAAILLTSYGISLALAVSVCQAEDPSRHAAIESTAAAFLLFAGMDLAFLVRPPLSLAAPGRLEEVVVFDVVLGILAALLYVSARISDGTFAPQGISRRMTEGRALASSRLS